MERLGLYGGSFAPPHYGHVHALKTFVETVKPDRTLVMPTAVSPHKEMADGDTPEWRLKMCRAAFENVIEGVVVSDFEILKGGRSYTVDTLKALSDPDRTIIMLTGTDMFTTLPSWYKAEEIFRLCEIVCVPRYSDDIEALRETAGRYETDYGAVASVIDVPAVEISSTEIRNRITLGLDTSDLIPKAVADIIADGELYR